MCWDKRNVKEVNNYWFNMGWYLLETRLDSSSWQQQLYLRQHFCQSSRTMPTDINLQHYVTVLALFGKLLNMIYLHLAHNHTLHECCFIEFINACIYWCYFTSKRIVLFYFQKIYQKYHVLGMIRQAEFSFHIA
jgi:hypothetical protein